MKRFIGYLLLSVSILISVFVGFVPTFSNVNAGADYAQGKEFIYQVSLKDETLNYINGTSSFADESASTGQFFPRSDEAVSGLVWCRLHFLYLGTS